MTMKHTRPACWAAIAAWAALAAASEVAAQNPAPLINQPLVPDAVAPGGPALTLTVNGTGFAQGATVNWNGAALATQFVSSSQLAATVPAADTAANGTAYITVVSPGGPTSSAMPFSVASAVTTLAFNPAVDYATAAEPGSVVTADFNGDGNLDVGALGQSSLSILLGNGDGTLQAPIEYALAFGSGTTPVAADLNGDGNLDLAFVGQTGTPPTFFAMVMLGNGDGTFEPPMSFEVGGGPNGIIAGDFNRDGKLDMAVSNSLDDDVSILLGNGDGTFQPQQTYATAVVPGSLTTGDFNSDGNLDLAVLTEHGVSVLLGKGDGTFEPHVDYPSDSSFGSVLAADLSSNGQLDLLANSSTNLVVLLGNGNGSFQAPVRYGVAPFPASVVAADLNGDDKLDAALSTGGSVAVLPGNGDGTFGHATVFPLPADSKAIGIAVGDFNNDGRPDVVTANFDSSSVGVLIQTQGPVASLSATSLAFGDEPLEVRSAAQTVKLTNTGASDLDISSVAASTNFVQTNTCGQTLAAGATCNINIAFDPTVKGPLTGTVSITDNAPGSPQVISLSGTGTLAELTPTSLSFGSIPAGTSASQMVTLTNAGTVPLSISHISLNVGGYSQSNNCGTSLAAKASCTITVTFEPGFPGTYNGSLDVSDNGGGSPQTVALTGTGT